MEAGDRNELRAPVFWILKMTLRLFDKAASWRRRRRPRSSRGNAGQFVGRHPGPLGSNLRFSSGLVSMPKAPDSAAVWGFWLSGRPDSNRRPSAWEADALPTELRPRYPKIYSGPGSPSRLPDPELRPVPPT